MAMYNFTPTQSRYFDFMGHGRPPQRGPTPLVPADCPGDLTFTVFGSVDLHRRRTKATTYQYARQMRRNPTPAEDYLWQRLGTRHRAMVAGKRPRFRRQAVIKGYIVDLWCPAVGLVIEIDGPIHLRQVAEDAARQRHLESIGVRFLRFTNDDVFTNVDGVIAAIDCEIVRLANVRT